MALTGAGGFVGGALYRRLLEGSAVSIRAFYRQVPSSQRDDAVEWDLLEGLDVLTQKLDGVEVVIHSAALVHQIRRMSRPSAEDYLRVNFEATETLARASAMAGVKRFVFLSSIKVNGEATSAGEPFRPGDAANPADDYARSKHLAERALSRVSDETGLEVVIVRIPLVYGPGVGANFRTMMQWVSRGVPLPFASIHNRRSLIALENLVDLLIKCIDHPAAANQTLLAADQAPVSTTELLHGLAAAMGKPSRLFPFPSAIIRAAAALAGRSEMASRLYDSLEVDASATYAALGWLPPVPIEKALKDTVAHTP